MKSNNEFIIDDEIISKLGLRPSDKPVYAQSSCNSRVFEYPPLENVFIMESDLYGNPMPKNSCFLAFFGAHGLVGKTVDINFLKNASVEEIEEMVQKNSES